jgi:2-C-methyl-D-erythritol 4-phosphate cytidylyltransferase
VIVPAAGLGVRLGPGDPKAMRGLCGEPLLAHAVRSLLASGRIDQLVVAAPAGREGEVRSLLAAITPTAGVGAAVVTRVVTGGDTRRASVAVGLAALAREVDVVLVHDAARPLVPASMVTRVVDAVLAGAPAVVPVLPVTDTIKRVDGDIVVETVDRNSLRAVQTPQGFLRQALERAHAQTTTDATDDATMVEEIGLPVHVVEGHDEALKITRPLDLAQAEAILRAR